MPKIIFGNNETCTFPKKLRVTFNDQDQFDLICNNPIIVDHIYEYTNLLHNHSTYHAIHYMSIIIYQI